MGKFADELAPKFADSSDPKLGDFSKGSLAWVIQRVIEDVEANPEMKQYGRTKLNRLRLIQGWPIGAKMAEKITKYDLHEMVKWRRKMVGAATVGHDITCISTSIKHYAETWDDLNLEAVTTRVKISKGFLVKQGLVGKANARTRLPEEEELELILAEARLHDQRKRTKVKCAEDFYRAGHVSGRRRGEVARMEHGDFDYEQEIYWVRDMKHPTKKKGNDKPFYLMPELAEIVKRQPRLTPDNPRERVFKVTGNSMGALYCQIKNKLKKLYPGKFEDLRLHDNRADCFTKLIDAGMTPAEVKEAVSGHERTSTTLEKSYDRRKVEQRMRPGIEKLKALRANQVAT